MGESSADARADRRRERAVRGHVEATAVGRRIRDARESAGMTQSALAAGLVSTAYISRIENGKRHPSRAIVEQFARRLGVPLEHLLRSSDDGYWARVGLAHARIRLLTGDAGESRVAVGEVATTPAVCDETIARETVRLEALACLNDHNLHRAQALLEWLDRGESNAGDLRVLAALCRCYLEVGLVPRATEVGHRAVEYVLDFDLIELPEATEALFWHHRALLAAGGLEEATRVAEWALKAEEIIGESLARVLLKASAAEVDRDRAARAASLAERAESILDLVRQRALLDDLRTARDQATRETESRQSDNNVWQNE